MKRLHAKDLVPYRTYYSVCCGNIQPIFFTGEIKYVISIGDITARLEYASANSNKTDWGYLGDMGLFDGSYENTVNTVLETQEEAEELVTFDSYKQALAQHWADCATFPYDGWF